MSVLRSFVLSSSCSDISANLLLLNQLETHGMKQLEWLPNRGVITDAAFVDPVLLHAWLDKVLPDIPMTMQLMHAKANNIFMYRLMEIDHDLARAKSDENFMQGLLLEMTTELYGVNVYDGHDEFELEQLRNDAADINKTAAFLQEFCWWLHQQLARKAQFYWVEFDFTGPHRGKPWLSEADLVWQLPVPKWWKRGEFKSYRIWRQYNKYQKLQREKAELDEM